MRTYSSYQFALLRICAALLTIACGSLLLNPGQPPAWAPWLVALPCFAAALCVLVGRLRRAAAALLALLTLAFAAFAGLAVLPLANIAWAERVLRLLPILAIFLLHVWLALVPPGESLRWPLKHARALPAKKGRQWQQPLPLGIAALLSGLVLLGSWILVGPGRATWFAAQEPWLVPGIAAVLVLGGLDLSWLFPPRKSSEPGVVFFDGVCGLCNSSVDFILEIDRAGVMRYAPLQGETAGRLLPAELTEDLNSMAFRDSQGRLFTRSDAILRIGVELGGMWRAGAIGLLIPRAWRNRLYDWVAENRYRWFGKHDACRMPTPEERELFLM